MAEKQDVIEETAEDKFEEDSVDRLQGLERMFSDNNAVQPAVIEPKVIIKVSKKELEDLKKQRTVSKKNHTMARKKLDEAVNKSGTRSEVKALHRKLEECYEDCQTKHFEYTNKGQFDVVRCSFEGQWLQNLDDDHNGCHQRALEYLAMISDTSTVFSSVSKTSRKSTHSAKAYAALKETEVYKKELLLSMELDKIEEEEREEEEKILRQIEQKRKQRGNQRELDKLRLKESILKKQLGEADDDPEEPSYLTQFKPEPILPKTPKTPVYVSTPAYRPITVTPKREPVTPIVANQSNDEEWITDYNHSKNSSTNHLKSGISARLPKITLDIYDGEPKEWRLFIRRFRTLVHDTVSDDDQRLALLIGCLSDNVRKSIAPMLTSSDLYPQALTELQRIYGDPFLISKAHADALIALPAVKENDPESLSRFYNELHCSVAAAAANGCNAELYSIATLSNIVSKLPMSITTRWYEHVVTIKPELPTVIELDNWLSTIAQSMRFYQVKKPQPGGKGKSETKDKFNKPSSSYRPAVNLTAVKATPKKPEIKTADSSSEKKSSSCRLCNSESWHPRSKCTVFLAAKPTERAEILKKDGGCFRCVDGNHLKKDCVKDSTCNVDGCSYKHHPLLHGSVRVFKKPEDPKEDGPRSHAVICHTNTEPEKSIVLLRVIPIKIGNGENSRSTYALLDSGSEATLIRQDLAEELSLCGPKKSLQFGTFDGNTPKMEVSIVDFTLSSMDDSVNLNVNGAYTVPRLEISNKKVDWPVVKTNWSHLKDLDLPCLDSSLVTVLIGQDLDVHDAIEVRRPSSADKSGPTAIRTLFGWCVVGHVPESSSIKTVGVNALCRVNLIVDNLHKKVEEFWTTESFGVTPQVKPLLSADDEKAMEILNSTIRCVDNRYEFGLMWKDRDIKLPDNRHIALNQLFLMEKKFARDPNFAEMYEKVINEYLDLNHARKLEHWELQNMNPRSWYLPHHGVVNPNRPGKVRVVFNAASKYKGIALNSLLHKGPDLMTSLLGVLLRFRRLPIPLSADIEKMFLQVRVREEDQSAFMFVWRPVGSTQPPHTYRMVVHLFGAVSSPTTCLYALQRTAEDNRAEYPDIADLVVSNFYVDNYLDSVETEDEAIDRSKRMVELLKLGGFKLNKWISSSRKVLSAMDSADLISPQLNLDLDELPTERTLGLLWFCEKDTFGFKIKKLNKDATTKREILSTISSMFDPLGFLAPVILIAKNLLQDIWKRDLGWDEPLPRQLRSTWLKWVGKLPTIESLRIHRCVRKLDLKPEKYELHIFSDASERGFGAVGYLRTLYADGSILTTFVMAKSRVAPIKQLSIPRLELQGAVLAYRLASTITTEWKMPMESVTFWTDSQTVLQWLFSTTCRFQAFVAHRVGEILSNTSRKQWRHVPGIVNPADDCSR